MKAIIFLCEAGVIALNEAMDLVSARRFSSNETFGQSEKGQLVPEIEGILKETSQKGFDEFAVTEALVGEIMKIGLKSTTIDDQTLTTLQTQKISLMVKSGLVESQEDAESLVRDYAISISEARLRELATRPDLQAMEAVQSLDEVDKALNLMTARIREWYGLYFPELSSLIEDPTNYAKIIIDCGRRENLEVETLKTMGQSEKRAEAIITAAEKSKGGEIRNEDLARIASLAQEVLHLSAIREKMAEHVEKTMALIAPNITDVAGATIGARLIAKSGGLDKMARLPASTIQVLGAEKALFRALRTGSNPPKHGVIFQHQAIHTAPKWQRGKIARALAAKIAIAARVDSFRGEREKGLETAFKKRLDEIKIKYEAPPKAEKQRFTRRREQEGRRGRGRKRPYKS